MYMLLFRHFYISKEAMFSCPNESIVSEISSFFSFLEGYYFAFANIFVMSLLNSILW